MQFIRLDKLPKKSKKKNQEKVTTKLCGAPTMSDWKNQKRGQGSKTQPCRKKTKCARHFHSEKSREQRKLKKCPTATEKSNATKDHRSRGHK